METEKQSAQMHFLAELSELRQQLMDEVSVVATRVDGALRGLAERDIGILDEVALGDAEINARQMAIDDRAFKLLALRQPVASDLRVIVAAGVVMMFNP